MSTRGYTDGGRWQIFLGASALVDLIIAVAMTILVSCCPTCYVSIG